MIPSLLEAIDADKAKLDAARPLQPPALALLRETFMRDGIPRPRAIDNDELPLRETTVVLEGMPLSGRSLREHCDATHHREAIPYLDEIVTNNEALSVWQIRNIHNLVLKVRAGQEACRYRNENVAIAGASTTPPDFLDLPAELAALVAWYAQVSALHPVARAAELHTRFFRIHPYVDGNVRAARLLLNVELMKSGYPPAVIREADRHAYCGALDKACLSGDYTDMTQLVAESIRRSLGIYLDVLGLRVNPEPDGTP